VRSLTTPVRMARSVVLGRDQETCLAPPGPSATQAKFTYSILESGKTLLANQSGSSKLAGIGLSSGYQM
jgi:hypothetical protein